MADIGTERMSTLKKTKATAEKKRIESIDDVFVDLNLKLRELSVDEITSKVRRKLLGNIDKDNVPKLIAEINTIWAGKRKITLSPASFPTGNILYRILYQELDKRNAEKNARWEAPVMAVLSQYVPLEIKLEGLWASYSFNTLMLENLKSDGVSTFPIAWGNSIKVKDFRRFLAEEIVRAEALRFAMSKGPQKFRELVKYCVAMTMPFKYEHIVRGRVNFLPYWSGLGNVTYSLPESEFIYHKDPPAPRSGFAFFVGVGIPKAYMSQFARDQLSEKLGLGWFSEKYGKMASEALARKEWVDNITDDDAARLEKEHREIARKFAKTCEELGTGNYVIDYAGEKWVDSAETGKVLDMITGWTSANTENPASFEYMMSDERKKAILEKHGVTDFTSFKEHFQKLQQAVRDARAAEEIFRNGTSRMFKVVWYIDKMNLFDVFAPGATYKDAVITTALQTYLSQFVKYRVAEIQYTWEEEREKGDRARSYQDTKEFLMAKDSFLAKSKSGWKFTKSEEVAKRAIASPLGRLFLDVELDVETDPALFERFEKEALEFISRIGKFPEGNRFKVRKLGNHKALGLYYPEAKVLVVDVDSPSSFVHEYGHLLDYKYGKVSANAEFEQIIDTTIKMLQSKFDSLPETDPLKARLGWDTKYNFEYYARPAEIFARAFEVFCALQLKINLSILKSREEYVSAFEYMGDKEYVAMISRYFGWLFAPKKQ